MYGLFVSEKKGITKGTTKAFQNLYIGLPMKKQNMGRNKLWVLQQIYQRYQRFIRTLKNIIIKYMTSLSKNVCIDKLDNIVDKYSNTYYITIKMKPIPGIVNIKIDTKSINYRYCFWCWKDIVIKTPNLNFVIIQEY